MKSELYDSVRSIANNNMGITLLHTCATPRCWRAPASGGER